MKEDIERLKREARREFENIGNEKDLEDLRVKYLGRKGVVSQVLADIGSLPAEQRAEAGRLANMLKGKIRSFWNSRKEQIGEALQDLAKSKKMDLTLPGRNIGNGSLHPLSLVTEEIVDVFSELGFEVAERGEIETYYYNFEALNYPADHPAMDAHDTFYITDDLLLRTHTSPVQIRVMKERKGPPIRMVSPGKCYRRDASDASHSPVFTQLEGLLIDTGITMAHLKGTLSTFLVRLFGKDTVVKFVPSFFPFTEPSAEVLIQCRMCRGKGCRVCGNGYLEIMGAGMVHPEVLKNVSKDNYNPKKYSGFAFGMGIDRVAMLKYGIDDIRLFYENDTRFLKQF